MIDTKLVFMHITSRRHKIYQKLCCEINLLNLFMPRWLYFPYYQIYLFGKVTNFHPVRGKKGSKMIHIYPMRGKFRVNIDQFLPQSGVNLGHHFIKLQMGSKASIVLFQYIQISYIKITPSLGCYVHEKWIDPFLPRVWPKFTPHAG